MKAKQRWKRHGTGFRADPEWLKAKEQTEANGPIVAEVIFFRTPSFRLPSHRYNKRLSLPGTNCRNL